jgi:tripartite-type tricarboxylate transporter receptor subunit TctC
MKAFLTAFALAVTFASASPGVAQNFPVRPIRLIAPYPPGGFNDVTARILGQRLGERLGQTVIIDNRPGGGSVVGTVMAAKAPADGYTLLYGGGSTFVINPVLLKNLPYDPLKTFDAIGLVCRTPLAVLAHPAVPAGSVKELIAVLAGKPGQYSYGSFGNGTVSHFAGEMFVAATGVKILHVPYKGSTPALNDLIAGQIQLSFDTVVVASPQARTGRIRIIAVTTRERSALLPDVPTVAESGYAGFDVDAWIGLVSSVGTPRAVIKKLEAEMINVVGTKDVRDRFAAIGVDTVGTGSNSFVELVKQELPRYTKIARDANITAE